MKGIAGLFVYLFVFIQIVDAQLLTKHQQKFIRKHAISIRADSNYQNGNWAPVLKRVKNKRLVFLGEFNHGSKEVFASRNELIKTLHKELGFNLILFESGLGEVGVINLTMGQEKHPPLISGFFSGWRNKEFEELMNFIQKNHISIGGFDVQRTGGTFTQYITDKYNLQEDFKALEQRFVNIKSRLSNYRTNYEDVKHEAGTLMSAYTSFQIKYGHSAPFVEKVIANRLNFLIYMTRFCQTKNWNERWEARDQAMAENVHWILNQYPPEQKAIIIAHNFHIATFNEKEEVMGEFLAKDFSEDMYVVGVFAKQGSYLNNRLQVEQISPPDSTQLDIKHIIEKVPTPISFLHIPTSKKIPKGGGWLFESIIVNDTFIDLSSSNHMNLSKSFDSLLLLEAVSPPQK